jgi:hypothetical protein
MAAASADGDLDRFAFIGVLRPQHRAHPPTQPTLDQQFQIHRTRLVSIETILERVIQRIQTEMPAASRIGSIQKRAMMRLFAHDTSLRPRLRLSYRQRGSLNVNFLPGWIGWTNCE